MEGFFFPRVKLHNTTWEGNGELPALWFRLFVNQGENICMYSDLKKIREFTSTFALASWWSWLKIPSVTLTRKSHLIEHELERTFGVIFTLRNTEPGFPFAVILLSNKRIFPNKHDSTVDISFILMENLRTKCQHLKKIFKMANFLYQLCWLKQIILDAAPQFL